MPQKEYPVYDGKHEAIIDIKLWQDAQAKRKATAKRLEKKHGIDHEHILSGIIKCPVCGAGMYGNRKRMVHIIPMLVSTEAIKTDINAIITNNGMNRKEFCEYFDIPYRTVTEWERGTRNAPNYVLRLLAYYIRMEKRFKSEENLNDKDY